MTMKNLILFILIIGSLGCTVHKNYYTDICPINRLHVDELYLLVALEFVKNDNKNCFGDCRIEVNCSFEYFDKCLEYIDSKYYNSIGLDYNINKVLSPNVFYVKSFGKIVFSKKNDETDYHFSPVLINEKSRVITVQVKNKNSEKYIVGFNILNNELYFGGALSYGDNCSF